MSSSDAGFSGSAASQDRSTRSIREVLRIVGPIAIGLCGAALRLDAWLRNYPLSLDEAALARNVIERPWTKLLGPLDYAQLAPPGFVLVEKAIVSVLGTSEYALRLFPLLCALAALWFCWQLCRRLLSFPAASMAFALVALNTSFIDYGMRAKPYAVDVAAALLVLLIATRLFQTGISRRTAVWLALAAGAAVLFSFASVFAVLAAAIAVAARARRHTVDRGPLYAAALVWVVSAGCGVLIATMSLSAADAAYMQWFWRPAFMPFPPKSVRELVWIGHQLKATFRWTLSYRASLIWIAAAALGIWSFRSRRQVDAALLLVMPLVLVVVASAAHRYPFTSGRIQLFLLPMLLMLVAEGTDWWRRTMANRSPWIGVIPAFLLVALSLQGTWSGWRIQRNGDLRSVFQYIKSHWRSDDRLFVHYTAGQVFLYYAPRLGFAPGDYHVGACSDDLAQTLTELEPYRGRPRVWLTAWGTDETDPVFRYASAIGTARETFSSAGNVPDVSPLMGGAAILYDLAAPGDASMTPATFAIREAAGDAEETAPCYGVFQALPARPAIASASPSTGPK